ncbi:flagellar hook-length control protein FliK [Vreelandella alkaliphila]
MTIELLLSMQGQGANSSSSSSAAPGSPRATQGMFLQAFTQAASYQARTLTDTPAENTPTVPLSDIVKQLASFDSELDEETLSNIVATVSAQGQTADIFSSGADSVAPAQTLEMASAAQEQVRTPEQVSSPLASAGSETTQTTTRITIEEVASRLALIASYSTPPTATNAAGSSAQPANPATPSAAASLSKAATQTSLDQLASANTLTAATLQVTPANAAPRDGQVALTGERVALTPQPTIQATTTQTAAQSAPSTPTSESLQGRSPAPSAGSATVLPPVTANSTAATLQGTPTSAAPQDGQVALTGERVALTPQPTIQATATQTTAQSALSTPTSESLQGRSPVPSAVSASEMPPLTTNGTAATLQDAPTSVVPRDGQVAQAGERVVAETSQAMTQASTNAAALVMPPLPANSSATSSATTLPNNTGELAQSAIGSSLPSALAATAQQAVGITNAPRPTPSSIKALSAEAATTPVNTPTLAASLETIPAQPFTSMLQGMHALSPLNTALAPAVNADAVASLFAEAETASVTGGASKGSEQALPASLTSPNQAMPNSPATATLNTPLTSPAWPSQLGQQLIQFAQRGGEHQVKMQLHPAELGPLSITLKVTEQGTQAHFLSSHAPVRQAIEQAIPQLREALAEQGISLGETSVGEQQNPNEQAFAQQTPGKAAGNRGGELGSDSVPSPTEVDVQGSPDGRVDLYA